MSVHCHECDRREECDALPHGILECQDNARRFDVPTPGPWYVETGETVNAGRIIGVYSTANEGSYRDGVCTFVNTDANARLIAAAPDMLAALRNVEQLFSGYTSSDEDDMLDEVRAAIARATQG